MDISEGGMGIAGLRKHPVGTHLIVNFPEHNGRNRYFHAKVVRCWVEESQTRMGLEFSDSPEDMVTPADSELRMAA